MADRAYQAVGVLAGRIDGGEIELLSGERFPATVAPVLSQWISKHPDEAGSVRIWLAYPRTTKGAPGLAFYLVGTPEDQADPQWNRQVDRFNIKGQVVVSRAQKDHTVVWIPRNESPPLGRRRHPDWKGRILFLRRALKPVRLWKGADVWIEAKRVGGELVIVNYRALEQHATTLQLPSGWSVPWPFRPTRSSVIALCKDSLQGLPPSDVYGNGPDGKPMAAADWVAAYDFRPFLRKHLRAFNDLQHMRALDLLPRQALYEGQPMSKAEIAREVDLAVRWGKFFAALTKYLDSLEPGQLIAVSKRCDPLAAILKPVMQQARSWFQLELAGTGQPKVWFEGAPVPHRVKKAALKFFAEDIAALKQADTPPPSPAETPLEQAVAYFRGLGCPSTYSPRQTLAWVAQNLKAEGMTDEQIAMHGWMPPDMLPELLRVELPHPLSH